MNKDKLFKALILTSTALYIAWFYKPYNTEAIYNGNLLDNLNYGVTTLGYFTYGKFFSYVLLILNIITAVGLMFYQRYFREILIVTIILGFIVNLLNPILVFTSIDLIILILNNLCKGAILYMAYFSIIASAFQRRKTGD